MGYPVLALPATLPHAIPMTKEEERRFWHGQDTKTSVDLVLGCPSNDLEPEDLVGWMAEGPPQALMPEGLVHWPFGAPEPEEVEYVKEAEESD